MSDPENHLVLKWSRCKQNVLAGNGIPGNNMMDLQQDVGFVSSLVSAGIQQCCIQGVYVCDTQTNISRSESCFLHFPFTKSTRRVTPVTFQVRSLQGAGAYRF